MTSDEIQRFIQVMGTFKKRAAPRLQRLLKVLSEDYSYVQVDATTDTSARISVEGVRILIRLELTTKISPAEVVGTIVAYEATTKNGNEHLERIGKPMPVEDKFPPSENPYEFLSEALTAILAKSDRPFTP